jgi:hypothetical protein
MYDLNGMRFKIEMATTAEQRAEIKRKFDELMRARGMPGLTPDKHLYPEVKFLTIDEAL